MKRNFSFFDVISFICITCCFFVLSCGARGISIVVKGNPRAVISVPANAPEQLLDTANLFAEYIKKSTEAELPVGEENTGKNKVTIHIGEDNYVRNLGLDIKSLDGDGYVISVPDRNNIVIAGPTDWGTEFGIYEFLERYVGVRWLMPGPVGEDVPHLSTITVPRETVREEPAYFSRRLSSPNGDEFARRNRHHSRVEFHHNLLNLFPASKYTKTHPEFYGIWDGKRSLPTQDDDYFSWEPCFHAEGITEEAIKNIKEYFKTHPEATSYSLGMNDNDHFCQCEKCLAKEGPQKNFLGYRDYSDLYFEWANKVVEGVLEEYPDKWFGTLAYWSLIEPPKKVIINPRIIPYITYGRIRWFEPDIRAEGHRITEWWKTKCTTLGWYDYIYGTPYILPRVFFHQMAEYLKYGYEAGVRASYGEIYYNWGEGPKEYLTLKLLWDPHLDVDMTLREWYERAVGKAAAPELEAYYSYWEKFWTERIIQSSWYSKEHMWMNFGNPGYVDIVTEEDLAKSRTWLEAALAKAETEQQKARAAYLLKAFEYYEASSLSFIDELRASGSPVASEDEALAIMSTLEKYIKMKDRRWELVDEFESDPVLYMPGKPTRYGALTGDRFGCYPLWFAYEWVNKGDGKVRNSLVELSSSSQEIIRSHAKLMLDSIDEKIFPVNKNSDFGKSLQSWQVTTGSEGKVTWNGKEGHKAKGALCAISLKDLTIEQKVPVENKIYSCLGFIKGPENKDPRRNSCELSLTVLDRDGTAIYTHITNQVSHPQTWIPIVTTIDIPKVLKEKEPAYLIVRLHMRNFEEGSIMYLDDFGLYAHEQ